MKIDFPAFVFNDENLDFQRFLLNIGKAKRSEKSGMKLEFFFEILRKKENNGIE